MMQHDELTAWLGDTELTGEQRARLAAEVEEIAARYPDPDDQDERDAAMSATVQYLLGEITPDQAGQQRRHTQHEALMAFAAAQQIARLAALDGLPEAEAGRRCAVDRMTVRKMLGKR